MNLRAQEPMSPDPYGEFFSPYLAMGNNPVSAIDPDGGRVMRSGSGAAFEADNPGRERKVDPFDMKGTGGGGTTYYRDGMQIESWTVPKSTSGSGVTMSSANIVFTSYSYTTKDGKVTSWNHDAIWVQYDKGLNNAFGTSFPQLGGNGNDFNGTTYYSGQDQALITASANLGGGGTQAGVNTSDYNFAAYLAGTITSVYEAHLSMETKVLEKAYEGAYANRRVIAKTIDYNKAMMKGTKFAGKALFGVGIVMSAMDVVDNNFSANSVFWAVTDTYMGYLGFVPGFQLVSGIYFTGRIGYQVYEEMNK